MYRLILAIATVLLFASCEKETRECPSTTEKTFNLSGFTRISAGGTFQLSVKQGSAFSIKAKGCSNNLNDLELSLDQTGKTLSIDYKNYSSNRYRTDFEITLPVLNNISLEGAATGTVSGFGQQTNFLRAILSGTAKCTINELPVLIAAEQSGASVLTLNGTSADLIANLSGSSKLNAYTANFTDADVYASGTSKIYVQVQNHLYASASGDSRVYYKGNPANVNTETSGTAKVIRE